MTAATIKPIAVGTSPISELSTWYLIDNPELMLPFLDRHLHLVPVLRDIVDAVHRFFPADDALHLQAIDDADTRTEHLYVIISTSLPRDEAEVRLDRFDEEWWLDALDRTKADLTIDVGSR
jgi:hypothetical protein